MASRVDELSRQFRAVDEVVGDETGTAIVLNAVEEVTRISCRSEATAPAAKEEAASTPANCLSLAKI